MASIQERLQMKRIPLDKWSIREQLFLAAAVACSGENWMSVSRSLKMYCGVNRPSDWFSQKSCAAQYGKLLENVEMPKRKKRTASERDTPTTVDTPGETIYRKLTQERIQELKRQIQEDQKEFSRLKEDIMCLHSPTLDENKVREMWAKIEQEKKQKEREQLQHQQWLKEREERKIEMEKAWRPGQLYTSSPSSSPRGSPLQPLIPLTSLKIKQEEMDIDDSAAKQGTSPLLTSLLKSPSPAPNPSQPILTSSPTNSRTAPTITNLLTGQTQIMTGSSQCAPEMTTIQFLPGMMETMTSSQTTPSQAAPTLSMLLDNKGALKIESPITCPRPQPQLHVQVVEPKAEPMEIVQQNPPVSQQITSSVPEVKDEDQQLMDDFNGLIPDNIDELADILTDNNTIILSPELLEEESILENVDSLIGTTEVKPKVKEEIPEVLERTEQDVIVISPGEEKSIVEGVTKAEESNTAPQEEEVAEVKAPDNENSSSNESKETEKGPPDAAAEAETIEIKSEPESSSDCEIRSDENSRAAQEVDSVNLATTPDDSKSMGTDGENRPEEVKKDSDSSNSGGTEIQLKTNEEPIKIEISTDDEDSNMKLSDLVEKEAAKEIVTIDLEDKTEGESVKMDIEETSDEVKKESPVEALEEMERKPSVDEDIFEDAKDTMEEAEEESMQQNQTTNVDTDDDYPIEVIKEDKVGRTKRDYSRKKPETLSVDSKKSEDSNEDSKSNLSVRMRLKERERSESPLVTDDDAGDSIPRTRRRYSSTHATDSIPSSPASSEDREYKAWKKAIMPAYNRLSTHKYASIFLRPTEEQQARYRSVILRPMDLHTIKRNLETGAIRTTAEFQRDVMLMCQNAMMFHKRDSNVYSMAKEMMAESGAIIESAMETWKVASVTSTQPPTKMRSRKSQRHPVNAN